MSPSVLGHLTLGYQLVWNRLRQIVAVQLFIDSPGEAPVDAEHLLRTLIQAWSLQSPRLILSVQSPILLADLLLQGLQGRVRLEVAGDPAPGAGYGALQDRQGRLQRLAHGRHPGRAAENQQAQAGPHQHDHQQGAGLQALHVSGSRIKGSGPRRRRLAASAVSLHP